MTSFLNSFLKCITCGVDQFGIDDENSPAIDISLNNLEQEERIENPRESIENFINNNNNQIIPPINKEIELKEIEQKTENFNSNIDLRRETPSNILQEFQSINLIAENELFSVEEATFPCVEFDPAPFQTFTHTPLVKVIYFIY